MTARPGVEGDDEGRVVSEIACRLVRIHGRVQGVGFREACVHEARRRGITGWVRNRMDGSVEATLQGTPDRVDALCDWLRDGDTPGLVERLDIDEIEPPFARFDRFARVPTA